MTCVEVKWNITDILHMTTRYKIYINEVMKNTKAKKFYIDKNTNFFVICDLGKSYLPFNVCVYLLLYILKFTHDFEMLIQKKK